MCKVSILDKRVGFNDFLTFIKSEGFKNGKKLIANDEIEVLAIEKYFQGDFKDRIGLISKKIEQYKSNILFLITGYISEKAD